MENEEKILVPLRLVITAKELSDLVAKYYLGKDDITIGDVLLKMKQFDSLYADTRN